MTERYPLGRNVNHDPRSRAFRVERLDSRPATVVWKRQVQVLDQGQLGSCTGNAAAGTLGTDPNWVEGMVLDEAFAVSVYSAATQLDSAPGSYPPDDTGSDGLSVAKVLKARNLVSGYQHAFGVQDAFAAIKQGPLMVGTEWTNGMFTPDAVGRVRAEGPVAGGHEYSCVGYHADSDLWEFVNSWGVGWGRAGHFFYDTATFDSLLRQQGDVVLLTPLSQPAPAPVTPVPVDAKVQARARLDAWAAKRHVGAAAQAARDWELVR